MQSNIVGKELYIHCYKHDGKPHRSWAKTFVLEETDRHLIVINDHARVTESDGRRWYTREPAICYFPKDQWYNVFCMIRKSGMYFYCNIASPILYDGEALKYIDYDLDLKVFPNYHYKILDEGEYNVHKDIYGYTEEMDKIFYEQLDILINMTLDMSGPFRPGFAQKWLETYYEMKEEI